MGALLDTTEEAKRKVLAIGAQAGESGVQAYQQAQAQLAAFQQQALQGSLADASLIGATPAAANSGYAQGAFDLIRSAITANQAGYQGALNTQTAGTQTALTHLGSLEGLIAAEAAAKAAAEGGGGGGGGGGRGSGGSGGSLSDSEMRVRLIGEATRQRDAAAADALDRLNQARQARAATSQQRGALKSRIQQALGRRRARVLLKRAPGRGERPVNRRIQQLQRRSQRLIRQGEGQGKGGKATPHINAEIRRLRQAVPLFAQRRGLQQQADLQQQALRNEYVNARQIITAPLAPLARQVALDSGLAPEEAYGLINDVNAKSLNDADRANLKNAGGPLAALGPVPTLRPRYAAQEAGVKVPQAQHSRKGPLYKNLASQIEAELRNGTSIEDVARQLEPLRSASWENVNKPIASGGNVITRGRRKIQVYTDNSGNKVTRVIAKYHPSHAPLVDLLLSDYAPAFGG